MAMNLKINNHLEYEKSLKLNKIFKEDMQKIISDISVEDNVENKVEHGIENDIDICRICFCENDDEDNSLISPCLCKGTQKYIHVNCLNEWRNVNINNPEKRDNCEICKFNFIIHRGLDLSYYKVKNWFYLIVYRYMFITWLSFAYGAIDYSYDFFTIKVLNFNVFEKCQILKFFKNMKKSLDNGDNFINIILYFLFIFSFLHFIVYLFLVLKILFKRKNIQNTEYNIKVYKPTLILKIQQSSFLFFYYFGLMIDDFNFFICILPLIFLMNMIYYDIYIKKTNIILDNLISEETILSFEENPLLDIQIVE
tara:strand:+ start:3191 stop:4120 length:930 start_codon:yes stop_codon:yes gene_type:complete